MGETVPKLPNIYILSSATDELAKSFFTIIQVITLVHKSGFISVSSIAVLNSVFKFSRIKACRLVENASAVELVIFIESSIIDVGIIVLGPFHYSVVFVASAVNSLEGVVSAFLTTFAFEKIFLEAALVSEFFGVVESVEAICLVGKEEPFIIGAIRKNEYSSTMSLPFPEASDIDRLILPNVLSKPTRNFFFGEIFNYDLL